MFFAAGRQIFIYGHRGVGKSSLAQTAAIERQSSDKNPIMLSCSTESTCCNVIKDLAIRAIPTDPRLVRGTLQKASKFSLGGFGVELSSSLETGAVPEPRSLNDCVALLDFVSHTHSPGSRYSDRRIRLSPLKKCRGVLVLDRKART